ncbi:hypothetical protein IJG44_01185 [bacterium]|nr:hypothetical protein [bacterium]
MTAEAVPQNAGPVILSVKAALRIIVQAGIGSIMNIVLTAVNLQLDDAKAVQGVVETEVLLNVRLVTINVTVRLPIIVPVVLGNMTSIAQTVVIRPLDDAKVILAAALQKSVLQENINVMVMHLTNVPVDIGNIMNIVPMAANLQQANVKVLHQPNAIMANINVKVLFLTIVLWEIGL